MKTREEQINDLLRDHTWSDSPERGQLLREDLGVDSLRLVEILVALEEAFGITLTEEELDPESFQKVDDLYVLLERHRETGD